MEREHRSQCKGNGLNVFMALVTGAGLATTAILIAHRIKENVAPTAEQLLARCDQAAEALEVQILRTA